MTFAEIWWILLLLALGSYLIGSINFSIIISKRKGRDIRDVGSGNPGMMNMSRNFGLKTGVLILFLDIMKGVVCTFVGYIVFRGKTLQGTEFAISDMSKYLAGFFAVLGHIFPFYLKFKGGKGISTTIGVFAVANPIFGVASALLGLAFILITSIGSMGSLIAVTPPAIAAEIKLYITYLYNGEAGYVPPASGDMMAALILTVVFIIGICVLTWVAHYRNIERLITGDEHITSWSDMIRKMKEKRKAARAEKKNKSGHAE